MSPLLKTLSLAIVALITSAGAAYFYPWVNNETKSSDIGEPLFKDYEPTTIRRIKLERFDAKTGKLVAVVARRKGEQWLLPDKENFVATNARHIAEVTNSLLQREVLEETTNRETDHSQFGVVDPALHKSTANKSALGVKITLEDANKRAIANLIVGKPAELYTRGQPQKHFVSVLGQPNVYMIEINPSALTTEFNAWIKPNLFRLTNETESQLFFEKANEDNPTQFDYKLAYDTNPSTPPSPGELPLTLLKRTNAEGELVDASLTDGSKRSVFQMVQRFVEMYVPNPRGDDRDNRPLVANVFANDNAASRAILNGKKAATADDFKSLKSRGVRFESAEAGNVFLSGTQGQFGIKFGNGLVISMYLGAPLADIDATPDQPERYGLLLARVDESLIETPEEPKENDDADEAEKEKKAYLLAIKERDETLKLSRVLADEFNQQHAGWIYAIPEIVTTNMLPVLEFEEE